MKRLVDLFLALCALAALCPLLLLLALIVRIDSSGPILYRQTRIGAGGRPFQIFKFRSMVCDADQIGGYQTSRGDPRITRSGKWLRRTSLDELPQLLNVLRGDMSFVGPRPDVPAQRELYSEEEWAERTSVLPGITGLAQATLRSEATRIQRLALDLQYVRERSLLLDFKILLMTFRQVLGKGGF